MPKINIRGDQTIYVCYLINKLSQTIENTKRRKVWEECMIDNLGINEKTYKSKRTFIVSAAANKESQAISKEIDKIINPFLPKKKS